MEQKQCNCCGKIMKEERGIRKEDALEVCKEWGYFSKKDMERHRFLICETCYDTWISGFKIPPVVENYPEAL